MSKIIPLKSQMLKLDILDCISNSDDKMTVFNISKKTGIKKEIIYTIITKIKEIKSKKINDILYWYVDEDQLDPHKNIVKTHSDPVFIRIYEDDVKNSPKNRTIFLSSEEHRDYIQNKKKIVK